MANKKLNAILTIGGSVAASLKSSLTGTKGQLDAIGSSIKKLNNEQKLLGSSIQTFGRMGKDVDNLRIKYAGVTKELERLRAAQVRVNNTAMRAASFGSAGRFVGGVGAGASAAGGLMAMSAYRYGIDPAMKRENTEVAIRNSGISKVEGDAMIEAARKSKQFGVSITEATNTIGELRTALGSVPNAIAALPITLKAMSGLKIYDRLHHSDLASGDSAYQLAKVADERGGASSPEDMRRKVNMAFKALTGSNGKVSVADMLTAVRGGKGAVGAMKDEAFFGDTFLMQNMSAAGYGKASSTLNNAFIGGHQDAHKFTNMLDYGLLDRKKVQLKNGLVTGYKSSALVDSNLLVSDPQKWVDKHLIPILEKRGIDFNNEESIEARLPEIQQFVSDITSNTNAGNMLLSRIRFQKSIWKDRHNVEQGNDAEASDKMNQNTSEGKRDNAQARFNDAQTAFGKTLMPTFTSLMDKSASFLEKLNEIMTAHPRMTQLIATGFIAIGTALSVVGPPLVAVAAGLMVFSNPMVLSGLSAVGTGIAFIGRALLLNPIGLTITAIAGAALLIYEYWGPIKGFFSDLWAGVKNTFTSTYDWIAEKVDKIGALAHRIGNAFGLTDQPVITKSADLPAIPSAASSGNVTHAPTYNIEVNQQAGQDTKLFIDEIMRKIKQKESVQNRSVMFDKAEQ